MKIRTDDGSAAQYPTPRSMEAHYTFCHLGLRIADTMTFIKYNPLEQKIIEELRRRAGCIPSKRPQIMRDQIFSF
jgi:hypothetical protein